MISSILWEIGGYFFKFALVFGGLWVIKRLIRFFGPWLKMIGFKPWD